MVIESIEAIELSNPAEESPTVSWAGGYIAGRLRTKWVGVHTHEVFFRDTAHGFLAWGLATVLSAAFLAAAASNIAGGASLAGVSAIQSAGSGGPAPPRADSSASRDHDGGRIASKFKR